MLTILIQKNQIKNKIYIFSKKDILPTYQGSKSYLEDFFRNMTFLFNIILS